jgi:hypothetical protein
VHAGHDDGLHTVPPFAAGKHVIPSPVQGFWSSQDTPQPVATVLLEGSSLWALLACVADWVEEHPPAIAAESSNETNVIFICYASIS